MADSIADFIAKIAPTLVNQRTTETTTPSIAPDALSASDAAFASAMSQAGSTQDALVQNIFRRAAISFAPTLAEEHTAGVYNSTTQAQLRNEAMAEATGEAAKSVLEARTQGLQIAGGISNTRVAQERGLASSKVQAPSLGSKAGTIATGVIMSQLAKKGITKVQDLFKKSGSADKTAGPEQLSGPTSDEIDSGAMTDKAFGSGTPETASEDTSGITGQMGDFEGLGGGAGGDVSADLLSDSSDIIGTDSAANAGDLTAVDAASLDPEGTAAALGAGAGDLAGGAELAGGAGAAIEAGAGDAAGGDALAGILEGIGTLFA